MFIKTGKPKTFKEQRKDWADTQQPIDFKTGRVNKNFDQLYGHKTQNPFHGDARDPNSVRRERVKIENEYNRYNNKMSMTEKLKYETHIIRLKEKEKKYI